MSENLTPAARRALPVLRVVARGLLRSAYRLRVRGVEHVPREGPALVVYNHVAFHDWLVVAASLPRLPRFVMHHHHWKYPALRQFFEAFEAIPIAPRKEDPERLARAMRAIDDALGAGELVAISPEGQMTPDGEMQPFRPGVERILARRPVPVVPVALRGLWGSFLSRAGGEPMHELPRRFRAEVEVVVGAPVPPERATAPQLRQRVATLRGAHP